MEIIGVALVQLFFIGLVMVLIFWFARREAGPKRPGVEQDPELLKVIKNITGKVPGLSDEDKELAADRGTFYTTAPFENTWERMVDVLTRQPLHPNPKYCWKDFKLDQAYQRMILAGGWTDHEKVGEHGQRVLQVTINCTLSFERLEGGGTAIHFQYYAHDGMLPGFGMFTFKMKRDTNFRLRTVCLQLSQDPNRGIPF